MGLRRNVGSSAEPPLMLTFVGFQQSNTLVVVGVLSLTNSFDYQTATVLALAQSNLLARAGVAASPRGPIAPVQRPNGSLGQPTPEDAVGAHLASYGIVYVGDCAYADPFADVGGYCSTLFENRGGEALYLGGTTFSEYDAWFLAERYPDGSWAVTDSIDVTYDLYGDLIPPPW